MKYQTLSLACTALALVVAAPASANVVYQSVADDSVGQVDGAWCADCFYYHGQALDQFTLNSGASINGVNLWIYASGGYDTAAISTGYTFNIYNSDRSSLLFSQLVFPVTTFATRQGIMSLEKQVGGSLSGLTLSAGTYWAGFEAPMMGVMGFRGGNQSLISDGPDGFYRDGDNAGYQLLGEARQGAVPEAATWAMMIGGFGLVGGAMRRRRTAVTFA